MVTRTNDMRDLDDAEATVVASNTPLEKRICQVCKVCILKVYQLIIFIIYYAFITSVRVLRFYVFWSPKPSSTVAQSE